LLNPLLEYSIGILTGGHVAASLRSFIDLA